MRSLTTRASKEQDGFRLLISGLLERLAKEQIFRFCLGLSTVKSISCSAFLVGGMLGWLASDKANGLLPLDWCEQMATPHSSRHHWRAEKQLSFVYQFVAWNSGVLELT